MEPSEQEDARALSFRLDALVLVCKACGKRSKGPAKEGRPKRVAGALKDAAKSARLRSRVVLTGCMGLCPRDATAVALVQGGDGASAYAVATADQARALLRPAPPAA